MIFSGLKINNLRWHDFCQAYKSMTYHVIKMFQVVTSEIYFVVVHTGRCLTRLRFGSFVHTICFFYMAENLKIYELIGNMGYVFTYN